MGDTGCRNETTITSLEGLNYTQYCDYDLQGSDLPSSDVDDFQGCVDSCTSYGPACFGVSWNPIKHSCNRKSHAVTIANLKASTSPTRMDSALVFAAQYEQQKADFPCPYPNLSEQKAQNGMTMKIFCGGVYRDYVDGLLKKVHVKSLDECLEHCAGSHPLCTRLAYYVNLIGSGWLNCALIQSFDDKNIVPYTRTMAHSAEIVLTLPKKWQWADKSIHKDDSGQSFKISHSDFRELENAEALQLGIYDEESIEDCLRRCSDTSSACVSAVFDQGLESGYENCYLFGKLPAPQSRNSNYTFLYMDGASDQFREPPPIPPTALSAGQRVGVVLGSSAALAIICFFLPRLRKWRKNNAEKAKFT